MVVASLALERLDQDRGDAVGIFGEGILDLPHRLGFGGGHRGLIHGEMNLGIRDPRPVELGEVQDLDRLGVGDGKGIPAPPVERFSEVQDLVGTAIDAAGPVPLCLPVERRLHSVLHCQRAPCDEEQVSELIGHRDLAERLHECSVLW